MKKFRKFLSRLCLILLVIIVLYFAFEIIKACLVTPRIMEKALKNVTTKVSDLNQWQLNALLAIEDPNFYEHKGVDLRTPGAGLTTITQSLTKVFYFNQFKPGLAKIKQTLIARYVVDKLVTKDDQLTLFLNTIYLGEAKGKAVFGFEHAAKAYYNKRVGNLTEDEYLSIVAMIIAPHNFHIVDCPDANAERTKRIKKVISGDYQPKHLMDLYYGELDEETQKGLPPASYVPSSIKAWCLKSLQSIKVKLKMLFQWLLQLFVTGKYYLENTSRSS